MRRGDDDDLLAQFVMFYAEASTLACEEERRRLEERKREGTKLDWQHRKVVKHALGARRRSQCEGNEDRCGTTIHTVGTALSVVCTPTIQPTVINRKLKSH